jgi:hypothetical protein
MLVIGDFLGVDRSYYGVADVEELGHDALTTLVGCLIHGLGVPQR